MDRWTKFNRDTKDNPLRELYVEAVEHIAKKQPRALDIAAGALNETKDMLGRGFDVTSIDANPDLLRVIQSIDSNALQAYVSTMEDFQYGNEAFDFIVAMFALPFISPNQFDKTFIKIVASLKPGGIFAFHLFGKQGDWPNRQTMTFHDKKSITKLTTGLEVIKCREIVNTQDSKDGATVSDHVFQLIVRQPT